MSTWIDVKQEDLVYDSAFGDKDECIDIYLGTDDFGANYLTVPVKFIKELLESNGYKIEKPNQ